MKKFESAYPFEVNLYLPERFNTLTAPSKIVGQRDFESETEEFDTAAGLEVLSSVAKELPYISDYKFSMEDNQLVETLQVGESGKFKLFTTFSEEEEKSQFLDFIFWLNGVFLFGEIEFEDEMICRDDICVNFSQKVLKGSDYTATWTAGGPFVNHFFIINREGVRYLNESVAIGGEPLTGKKSNFYLLKTLPRWGSDAYIRKDDARRITEVFEGGMVQAVETSLECSDLKYSIIRRSVGVNYESK